MAIQTDEQRKAMFAKENKPKAAKLPYFIRHPIKAYEKLEEQHTEKAFKKESKKEAELEKKLSKAESREEKRLEEHNRLLEKEKRLAELRAREKETKKALEQYTITGKLKRGAAATGAAFGRGAKFVGQSAYKGGKLGFQKLQEYEAKANREPRTYHHYRKQYKTARHHPRTHHKRKTSGEFENIFDL